MFYIASYVVLAMVALLALDYPKVGRTIYKLVLVFLFLVTGFRFEVGCDWLGYRKHFNLGVEVDSAGQLFGLRDPGWWLLIDLLNGLGVSFLWLNLTATAIFFLGVHLFARNQPDRLNFLVFLFPVLIVHLAMSSLRQSVAIAIISVALAAFVQKRLVAFLLLVALASSFHSSAMVFVLLAPLVNGSYTAKRFAAAGLLALPGAWLIANSAAADLSVTRYVDTDIEAAGGALRVGLLTLTGCIFFIFLRRGWAKTHPHDYKLASIGSIGMILLVCLLPLSTVIADRFGYYFIPVQAMILARVPFLPLGRGTRLYPILIHIALGATLAVWISLSSHYKRCYEPYQSWLFGIPETLYLY